MIDKVKIWLKETGLTNLLWAAGFIVSAIAGWWFIAGGCLGIFLYVNFNVIRKLIDNIGNGSTESEVNSE